MKALGKGKAINTGAKAAKHAYVPPAGADTRTTVGGDTRTTVGGDTRTTT